MQLCRFSITLIIKTLSIKFCPMLMYYLNLWVMSFFSTWILVTLCMVQSAWHIVVIHCVSFFLCKLVTLSRQKVTWANKFMSTYEERNLSDVDHNIDLWSVRFSKNCKKNCEKINSTFITQLPSTIETLVCKKDFFLNKHRKET